MSSFVLPYAPSETVGFLPDRLDRLTAVMARQIEEKKAPGVSMLIARHGKVAYRQCLGELRPGGPAMSEDAIFRIYSMTKPIVSVAAMMLVEEGRLSIVDPVSAYIPAFADVKVGVESGGRLDLAPLKRPITIQDLMRHTSGITYGFTGASAVQKLTFARPCLNFSKTDRRADRRDRRAASAASAGRSLGVRHLDRRARTHRRDRRGRDAWANAPLEFSIRSGWTTRRFFTPDSQTLAARRAVLVRHDRGHPRRHINVTAPPRFEMGGTGLVSTLTDYSRFAAMLDNGGTLRRHSHSRTANDRLHGERPARRQATEATLLLWPGHGFGLGFAVRTAPGQAPTAGSVGEFFWGGMMGTAFWISPRDSLFAVLMVQAPEYREYFRVLFRNLVSAAIA